MASEKKYKKDKELAVELEGQIKGELTQLIFLNQNCQLNRQHWLTHSNSTHIQLQ